MKRFKKAVADITKSYPKLLLIALFWSGIIFQIIRSIVEAFGIQTSAELRYSIILHYLISTCGLAIVNAIEDKKPVVINLNGETTVNEVKE